MKQHSMSEWQLLLARISFCAAAVVFPYSVAANNVALGLGIFFGVVSGHFWAGIRSMALLYPKLAAVFGAYLLMFPLGLLWTSDLDWGLHVLSHQWFWLAVPIVFYVFTDGGKWRDRFLLALSFGLATNLLYCVAQALELVVLTTPNSGPDDATGHLGHISFGFVYGIWAGWLFYRGWLRQRWQRWGSWFFAVWAWSMIYLAQGRGGYIVAAALLMAVMWKLAASKSMHMRHVMSFLMLFLGLVAGLLLFGPGKSEIASTAEQLQMMGEQNFERVDYRWAFWLASVRGWVEHPVLGVGTGGFPHLARDMKCKHADLNYPGDQHAAHPHNAYLLSLVSWGPAGLGILLLLLYFWIREGWRAGDGSHDVRFLLALTGVALATQGLVASSLEEHASGVFASLLLGLGLSLAHKPQGNHRRMPGV